MATTATSVGSIASQQKASKVDHLWPVVSKALVLFASCKRRKCFTVASFKPK